MKKIILTTICLIGLSFAQIEYGGTPKFFNNRSLDINSISINNAPMVDRDFNPMVFIYGHEYDVNINVLNSATSINESGDVTYLLGISSDGAYGIGLNFREFYLTDNATLYIYDEEQTYFLGSLTSKNNKKDATFGNGTQITFLTSSRYNVDKFHEIGLKAGGTSEGSGGERPEGSGVYYSYLRDLDGNKICAFTNSRE